MGSHLWGDGPGGTSVSLASAATTHRPTRKLKGFEHLPPRGQKRYRDAFGTGADCRDRSGLEHLLNTVSIPRHRLLGTRFLQQCLLHLLRSEPRRALERQRALEGAQELCKHRSHAPPGQVGHGEPGFQLGLFTDYRLEAGNPTAGDTDPIGGGYPFDPIPLARLFAPTKVQEMLGLCLLYT